MRSLTWSTSHAVFVTEIDDEHKEIFRAVADLQTALSSADTPQNIGQSTQRLCDSIEAHFAHEERLMRAARYSSLAWHKRLHDGARRRVAEYAARIGHGDAAAGTELVEHLTSWLRDHTGIADRMMGAFLRNQRRCVKVTFRAGTKPVDAADWVDTKGDKFDPLSVKSGF